MYFIYKINKQTTHSVLLSHLVHIVLAKIGIVSLGKNGLHESKKINIYGRRQRKLLSIAEGYNF
jgi:hypothetical protein